MARFGVLWPIHVKIDNSAKNASGDPKFVLCGSNDINITHKTGKTTTNWHFDILWSWTCAGSYLTKLLRLSHLLKEHGGMTQKIEERPAELFILRNIHLELIYTELQQYWMNIPSAIRRREIGNGPQGGKSRKTHQIGLSAL